VFSVDDHPLLREGIAAMVRSQPDMTLAASATSGREAIQRYREHQPDVTLMDLRLPDMSGIDAMITIRAEFPAARVMMLTTFDGDVEIERALLAGARGYVLKSLPPRELADAIRQVHAGRKRIAAEAAALLTEHMGEERLTQRERDVLTRVAGGLRNRDIGEDLAITEQTVKVHMRNVLGKLNARDRTEAVTIALRRGIIQL
jgi:DNA-binding NarL/FixJ family response regulator